MEANFAPGFGQWGHEAADASTFARRWCPPAGASAFFFRALVLSGRHVPVAVTDPDRAAAKRAFEAMMQMTKIDIAAIEAARRG